MAETVSHVRVARKAHTCDECGETINPGQTYHDTRYFGDHEAGTHKACHRCDAAAAWLSVDAADDIDGGLYTIGGLWLAIDYQLDGRPWPEELKPPRWVTHCWTAHVVHDGATYWLANVSGANMWWPHKSLHRFKSREALDAALAKCTAPDGELIVEEKERER